MYCFPKEKKKYQALKIDDESQEMVVDEDEMNADKVGYFELMVRPRFLFACLAGTLSCLAYAFQEPILADRLIEFELS